MSQPRTICTRCVMDTSAPTITFDAQGVCHFCTDYLKRSESIIFQSPQANQERLQALVDRIKQDGKGKRYDCVVGVSGGVDSSWVLVQSVKLGLRPLAVHMDNGWNSEAAQNNIEALVKTLGVDLYTHVIDWTEYRNLMEAFFRSDVIDIEILYDNAMQAVNYRQAAKVGVKYIMSGSNQATEGMTMPEGWNWFKLDLKNIRAIGQQFTRQTIKTFPTLSTWQWLWFDKVKGIHWTSILDLMPYNKADILDTLERDYGYKRYPYKHYESVFTRFYQGYILPKKFGVDKRKLHHSTLIMAGQMTREQALADLQLPAYPTEKDAESDVTYFLKKMKWSSADLDQYLARPPIPHDHYPTEIGLWNQLQSIKARLRKWLK